MNRQPAFAALLYGGDKLFLAMPFPSMEELRAYWKARRKHWHGFRIRVERTPTRELFYQLQQPTTIP
jgi:hypothetical protein